MSAYTTYHDVQLKHCDPTGIVFLPRYFEMVHAVIEDWFDEALDWPMSQLLGSQGMGIPIRGVQAEFPVPSRLGDRLQWKLQVTKIGETSMDLLICAAATQGGDMHMRCTATIVLTELNVLRTRKWPMAVRKRLDAFLPKAATGAGKLESTNARPVR